MPDLKTVAPVEHFSLMTPGSKPGPCQLEVVAPYDGKLIATTDTADEPVVEQAVGTAYSLYRNRDAWLSGPRRIDILRKAASL
ncbi:MAG: hypothetical protein JOZ62_13685, partial [Acidobacteriaceae bacterium]|nr:hypothetical protein [Acidobacteriaceae bacterium]